MNITVTFMMNDGSDCVFLQKEIELCSYLSYDDVPAREGYSFDGWYTEPVCENRFRLFAGRIKNDIILYAKWIAPISDYSEDYIAARKAFSHFLEYNEPSIGYLNATVIKNSLFFPLSKNLAQAKEAKTDDRSYLDRLRFSVNELVRIHEEGYRITPLWKEGNMPKVDACENRPECPQSCLEDEPGFEPYLIDMRLPEPERAKGTVFLSPSIRAATSEILLPARKWQSMGYNCFGVAPRFNTEPRDFMNPKDTNFAFSYSFPEEDLDVQRAIRMIKYNAKEYGIDPDRIITIGFSKGNCAHFVSNALYNQKPEEIEFKRSNGTYEKILPGYVSDEIDEVPANAAVNIFIYGDRMAFPDAASMDLKKSPLYTRENLEKGIYYPACFFMCGNYDRPTYEVGRAFQAHNDSADKLYDIPFEFHVIDKVPHGVCLGEQYPNFYRGWDLAEYFASDNFKRSTEREDLRRI